MSASPDRLEDRMPVWEALTELFLDTDLQKGDFQRLAGVLAASPYSEAELFDILRFEVAPACQANLRSVAGDWVPWDREFVLNHIAPRLGKRPRFRWPLLTNRVITEPWDRLRSCLRAERNQSTQADAPPLTNPTSAPDSSDQEAPRP